MGAPRRCRLTAGSRAVANHHLRFTSDKEYDAFRAAFREFLTARGMKPRRFRWKYPKHDSKGRPVGFVKNPKPADRKDSEDGESSPGLAAGN
jgi:hypothetical protein